MVWLDLMLMAVAVTVALALKPWRAVDAGGPPWPWLAWWAALPALWGVDRLAQVPLVQPLSGACLLMWMAGWPLAVLGLLPVAAVVTLMVGLSPAEGVHRLVWLGLVPMTLALALGAGIRRWLPHHLFVYILGRGFFATAIAGSVAGVVSVALHGVPGSLQPGDMMLARFLAAWGDAFLSGMVVAIFVAFRPQWLATYADRLYLPGHRP